MNRTLNTALAANCEALEQEFGQIPNERKQRLETLGNYISAQLQQEQPALLTVICTHNSRRSHMGQLWLKAAAAYYGLEGVETFSGGTEATAFHPHAVEAMQQAGFHIHRTDKGANPRYVATMGEGLPAMVLFSKKFGETPNPQTGFAALMVCSEADEACPFVPGANARFSLPYEDPKKFDGTGFEKHAYDERARQIGREMLFAMEHAMRLSR